MRYTDVRLEEDPPYPLKKVPEEAIHQIEMRKEASWKRLPGAFSGGDARHQQVKKEHLDSVRILKMTGSRPFDLDTAWLPREEIDDDDDDDDDNDDGLSIEGGMGHGGGGSEDDFTSDDSSDKSLLGGDERLQQEGLRQRSRERKKSRSQEQREIPHGALNTFAFFKTAGAPFLVGKVREEKIPAWVKEQLKEEAPDTDGDDDISAAGESNVMVGGKREARAQDTGAEKPEEEEEEAEAGGWGGTGAAEQQQRRQQQKQQTAAQRPRGLGLEAAGRTSGPKARQVEQQRAGRTPGNVEVERLQRRAGDYGGGGSKSPLGSTTSRRDSSRGRRPRKWLGDGDDENDR
eukprot:jgi/Undpi1/7943/HiC_scaffold_24.g10415.m1